MNRPVGALLFTLLNTISTGALAHYLYIMPEHFQVPPGGALKVAVHNGDSFPESESVARGLERFLLHAGGQAGELALQRDDRRLVGETTAGPAGHFFATTNTAISVIELEPDEFIEYLEEEGLTHVQAWREQNGEADKPGRERYAKYTKAILLAGDADDGFARVLGLPIEFVPEKSPYQSRVGDTLPVRVLYQGEPVADLEVTASWVGVNGAEQTRLGRTDAEGRVQVPLAASGAWRLHAILMERRDEPEVDWESHWAILTFAVP